MIILTPFPFIPNPSCFRFYLHLLCPLFWSLVNYSCYVMGPGCLGCEGIQLTWRPGDGCAVGKGTHRGVLVSLVFTIFPLRHLTPQVLVGFPGDCCYGPVTVTTVQSYECVETASTGFCSFGWQMAFLAFFELQGWLSSSAGGWGRFRCSTAPSRNQNLHVVTNLKMGF